MVPLCGPSSDGLSAYVLRIGDSLMREYQLLYSPVQQLSDIQFVF
jgi:hypothetical protein